jgi:hypothetical protein
MAARKKKKRPVFENDALSSVKSSDPSSSARISETESLLVRQAIQGMGEFRKKPAARHFDSSREPMTEKKARDLGEAFKKEPRRERPKTRIEKRKEAGTSMTRTSPRKDSPGEARRRKKKRRGKKNGR